MEGVEYCGIGKQCSNTSPHVSYGLKPSKVTKQIAFPTTSIPILSLNFEVGLLVANVHKFWGFWGMFGGSSHTYWGVRGP